MYDLFMSYHWLDRVAVEEVARSLRDRGIKPFLDRWYLVPGRSWVGTLEKELANCKAVAIFIGPQGMGRWQQREREYALDRQTRDENFPVIPVLLPGADPALGFLSLNTWIDLQKGTTREAIENLAAAMRGETVDPDQDGRFGSETSAMCPFRGLRPFREEDQPFFCGRDAFTGILEAAVEKSSLVAVVGASGSGKSTLLALIAGLLTPDAGRIMFDGEEIARLDDTARARIRARRIGIVLQRSNLIPFLSALENVELAMTLANGGAPCGRARELLQAVGLEGRLDQVPRRLSGGEAQRVAVAVALANEPDLLLADEPTGELDSVTAAQVTRVMFDACRDRGLTVLLMTHSDQLAERGQRRLLLENGVVSPA